MTDANHRDGVGECVNVSVGADDGDDGSRSSIVGL